MGIDSSVCVHLPVSISSYYLCLCLQLFLLMTSHSPAQENRSFAIAIHGGAGGDPAQWDEETKQNRRAGLTAALERGLELLRAEGAALDVVEQVVRMLEDDPTFNAGRGCVLNSLGQHELDASIMDGQTLACGAVAGVRRAQNPIALARRVMSDTRHVLLIGDGADQFAESLGSNCEMQIILSPRDNGLTGSVGRVKLPM
jgi:isoaspartyl peptidase/L-asparaginase-like protein (Ntn-hydrolase superfamily)